MEHYWAVAAAMFGVVYFIVEMILCCNLVVYALRTVVVLYLTWMIMNAIKRSLPRQTMEDTTNKAVFITGCDSGFGYDISIKLHDMGFHVFSGCLSLSSKGAKNLKMINSPLLNVLQVDVTQNQDIEEALQTVKDNLAERNLWAVVNNAGVGGVFSEIEWIPPEVYQKVLEVNTVGVVRVTKAFLPLLRKSEGRVVIVASLAGRYVFPGGAPYSISKHAVLCYADALRREMKKWNISVHTIEPSFYKTPIMDSLTEAAEKMWEKVPKDIHDSYGDEYFKDFEGFIGKAISNAKPASQIYEVTDDIIDAIAGQEPRIRYVPSVTTYIRSQVISSLPSEAQDFVLCKMVAPKTPPADVAKQQPVKRVLQRSYSDILKDRIVSRSFSMPIFRKSSPSPTPTPTPSEDGKFKFDNVVNLPSE